MPLNGYEMAFHVCFASPSVTETLFMNVLPHRQLWKRFSQMFFLTKSFGNAFHACFASPKVLEMLFTYVLLHQKLWMMKNFY